MFFASSAGFVLASFIMTFYFYTSLPEKIPAHFGLNGLADAWIAKNLLTAFLAPLINLLIFALFLLIYLHPQYTSWPTTLILMTVEKQKREKIFDILRSMNASILFWITLLFSYLQFSIIATTNNRSIGISSYIMFGFLTVIFSLIIIINLRMLLIIRRLTKNSQNL